ncbi:hypothetical protein QET40_06855 [Akkermansia sp. N21169]|uniref:hypothetical protein n=1 Tax=Akkermansia sp. N21169 TaxID=3040765 RepID=UPI00244EF99F|nr:hypothetical protein [Akkermansia sp. N21169]MDH3068834.1 hypothetical protein [Akkermansia sp. N21169]
MSFKQSAPPPAPTPTPITDAGDSKLDAKDNLQDKLKKKRGLASTIKKPAASYLSGGGTTDGNGNQLRKTLG